MNCEHFAFMNGKSKALDEENIFFVLFFHQTKSNKNILQQQLRKRFLLPSKRLKKNFSNNIHYQNKENA
ncbi:CLUMA_CG000407, isoform A [Clunio marinus]|uniref:CLUMA_CG000407, isoform A n=1 Tax=Clunio marinus TaxID=568069 RepID=A0A1J1HFX7_9DIPT|nr:CLUMA_CG000407, isoform A [Clunio marinus]